MKLERIIAKKRLCREIAAILRKDDDIFPEEVGVEGETYDAWAAARDELVKEFERRGQL